MEHKTFPLAAYASSAADTGIFAGYASVWDVVDKGGDVVARGAFSKALPDFVRDGFISWSHDWSRSIAMPLEAREDDHGLYLAGRFHATPTAQEARTIARERIDAGLRVGLSIGYGVEDFAPVSLPGGRRGRILKTIYPLHEVGLVMVPMNRAATISSIKSLDPTCQDDRCLLAALAAAEAERGVAEVLAQARRLGVPV